MKIKFKYAYKIILLLGLLFTTSLYITDYLKPVNEKIFNFIQEYESNSAKLTTIGVYFENRNNFDFISIEDKYYASQVMYTSVDLESILRNNNELKGQAYELEIPDFKYPLSKEYYPLWKLKDHLNISFYIREKINSSWYIKLITHEPKEDNNNHLMINIPSITFKSLKNNEEKTYELIDEKLIKIN